MKLFFFAHEFQCYSYPLNPPPSWVTHLKVIIGDPEKSLLLVLGRTKLDLLLISKALSNKRWMGAWSPWSLEMVWAWPRIPQLERPYHHNQLAEMRPLGYLVPSTNLFVQVLVRTGSHRVRGRGKSLEINGLWWHPPSIQFWCQDPINHHSNSFWFHIHSNLDSLVDPLIAILANIQR